MVEKIKKFTGERPVVSVAILAAALFIFYLIYGAFTDTSGETRYVTAAVEKGTITSSVAGTGQVSVLSQIELKPKASGDVVKVYMTEGQSVKAGALLVQLDSSEAAKTVRDAKVSLESAKISLEKLQQPADALSYTQAQNSLTSAKQAKEKAESDLEKAYDDTFTSISNTFLDMPSVATGVDNVLYRFDYSQGQKNIDYYFDLINHLEEETNIGKYKDNADSTYQTARKAYDQNFLDYKATSRYAATEEIETLLNETYDMAKSVAEAVKNTENYLSFVKDRLSQRNLDIPSQLTAHQTNLANYTETVNTHLVSLLNAKNTIKNCKDTINANNLTIKEKTEAVAQLEAGTDPLDIKSAELAVRQKQNALYDANQTLGNYSVRAPFDGIIAGISVKKGGSVSSGTSMGTLITNQRLAEISLNEVDVAKISIGDKAVLTFDAIEDLTLTGAVQEIDTLGTVNQGVVSYNARIGFDTQDERVKVGMSVSASVITEVKQDILIVPNSAVKTQGNFYYVEMLDASLSASDGSQGVVSLVPPKQQAVEIGLSNDDYTEILSGLNEGDQVVTRTITASKISTTTGTGAGTARGVTGIFSGGGGPPR
ncbi:efflux RND transporter periplasmic adaptor subunit [Candidatus Peregrinibacteria bacterium]|nr:efflux RND transporter periplasmic adaptor subunit [Candidatus Peregrinibacteria bacterium]